MNKSADTTLTVIYEGPFVGSPLSSKDMYTGTTE